MFALTGNGRGGESIYGGFFEGKCPFFPLHKLAQINKILGVFLA